MPATHQPLRWFIDENSLGVAKALQYVRGDVTWPGAPGGPIESGATDTAWLPIVGQAGLIVLTRFAQIRRGNGSGLCAAVGTISHGADSAAGVILAACPFFPATGRVSFQPPRSIDREFASSTPDSRAEAQATRRPYGLLRSALPAEGVSATERAERPDQV